MTSGFETYKIFHAIQLHFTTPSYDFFKYQGKSNVTPNAWYKRNDKYHFEKLGSSYNHQQLIGIFVSYFVQDCLVKKPWGLDLLNWANTGYLKWVTDIQSLPNIFEQDLHLIKERGGKRVSRLFNASGNIPEIIQMGMNKDINLASLVIILDLIKGADEMVNQCTDTVIWPDVKNLITKYRPFIAYNNDRYSKIINKVFS